ncbi:hypothetical protein [Microbacterium sp. SORGH_AS_0344]|uniref:hypothetical protein n=1 Tax=Microbacterium sp. SORGH_AS_0344 TaxID=3041767 RepID=UPI00278994DB|nr:hypothetical protein [Microbacterium sp. SORGH_AS_0344]MDQ1082764.1 hypothetical protein [Microbacterium sp. SORGH_AS_0344]
MFTSAREEHDDAADDGDGGEIASEDEDDHGRHRHQRHRTQEHRERHERVLDTLAELEDGRNDEGHEQSGAEADGGVTDGHPELTEELCAVGLGGGDGEQEVPDVQGSLADVGRHPEQGERTHPDHDDGDDGEDERQQTPPQRLAGRASRRPADVGGQIGARTTRKRRRGTSGFGQLLLGGGRAQRGHGGIGHRFVPFDQGATAREISPRSP